MQGIKPIRTLIKSVIICCMVVSGTSVVAAPWHAKKRLQNFPGVWEQVGTGRIFHITGDGMRFYNATRKTCSLQNEYDNFRQANRAWGKLNGNARRGRFSVVPSGGTEHLRFQFSRLKQLPEVCVNAPDEEEFDPEFIFEHTWHVFNDYYPFFSLYELDWQQQYDQFRSRVTTQTNRADLFTLLAQMIAPLDDGHIDLSFEQGELEAGFSPAIPLGWSRHFGAISNIEQEDGDDVAVETVAGFNQLLNQQYGDIDKALRRKTFKQWKGNGEDLPPLVWGTLQGNIAYLQINSMGDNFVKEKEAEIVTSRRDRRRINRVMNRVMRDLNKTNAMIVDVRFNGGGFDSVALALASRFADKKRIAFTKRKYQQHAVGTLLASAGNNSEVWRIKPRGKRSYTKPVVLITGPDTASAAEIFTMAMRSLPHVTHIGQATQGAHSDILPVSLNENWSTNLSHEIYTDGMGNVFEGEGIPPLRKVSVSSPKALNYGIFPAVDLALHELGAIQPLTQVEFEERVQALMGDGSIPGFSVAWLDKAGRLSAKAYGYADLEQGVAATVNTPYKVGSVSKTIVGIGATQMLERGMIDFDSGLASILPFNINHPTEDSSAMTLRQLVTHTASINDSEAYVCAYYLEADNSSLAAALTGQDCPSPVMTKQPEFLSSYLTQNGALYSADDNFIDQPLGTRYNYSNIGAALTAEVLASAAGMDFESWTELNVFQPLGMSNTHWFNSRFQNSSIKPAIRYVLDDEAQPAALPEHGLATWADGDLRTSVIDLSTLLLSIISPEHPGVTRILSDQGIAAMLSPQTEQLSDEGEQGIFWTRDNFMFGHDGGDPGVISNLQYSPELDMGFVFMMNVSGLDEPSEAIAADKFVALQQLVYQRGLALKAGF